MHKDVKVSLFVPCTKCSAAPRVPGQRWCTACRTAHQRARRAAARARQDVLADPAPAARDASNTTADAPTGVGVLQTPVAEALDHLREAREALTRVTRDTDWRRSPIPPSTALRPLLGAVRQAEQACRALGVQEAALTG